MYGYVHAEASSDEDETNEVSDSDIVLLPYSFDLALDLWAAWDKHGVTATEYLAQPKAWRNMIHTLNRFYNRVPKKGEKEFDYRDLLDGDGLPPAEGWDAFAGNG